MPTLIGTVCCLKTVWFEFTKIKGTNINLHVKLLTFKAAKLKGFTVTTNAGHVSMCQTILLYIVY